jgi:serine/threonine-protein kinase RsbW
MMMQERAALSLPASMSQWPQALAFLEAFCGSRGVAHDDMLRLVLVAEELFTNAVEHGYADGAGDAGALVRLELAHEPGRLQLFVEDSAPAFDPLAQARRGASGLDEADVEARPVGGLGLVLVEQLAAEARYAREQGCNRLWITLAIAAPPG